MPRVAPEGPGARPRAHAMASPSGEERSVGLGCEQGAGPARAVSGARPRRGGGDASETGSGPPPPAQICSQGPGRQAGAGQGPGTRRRHPEVGVGWMLWGCRRRLPRFRPGESPGTLRSTSGVTGHSFWAPRSPRFCGSRPKGEAGKRSREPPTCSGACAQRAQLGPGKGKPGGLNAQAQGSGGALRSGRVLWACAKFRSKGRDGPKGRSASAHAHT